MQKIISAEHQVLIYHDFLTSWYFGKPTNSDEKLVYEVVLEEMGRAKLCYNIKLNDEVNFSDDPYNSKIIQCLNSRSINRRGIQIQYDGCTTNVISNSGQEVGVRALFWIDLGVDFFRLLNKSDIWVPVANEFHQCDSEISEESRRSFINKYASENSRRLEQCLQRIQDRLGFADNDVDSEPEIHMQAGFRTYNYQATLEEHFSGRDLEEVQTFSWEKHQSQKGGQE